MPSITSVSIAPSILSADFGRLAEEIAAVEEAGADLIHIDVMDGHFVPNITIGPLVVKAVKKAAKRPLDVHLMIANPNLYIDAFADAGADWLTVHVESGPHPHRLVGQIRARGCRPGLVLNPATPLTTLDYLLDEVDLVMLMSVNPGFGGQKFIESSLRKIAALRQEADRRELALDIEIDGGVAATTITRIAAAGANIFVAGSAIYGANDYRAAIQKLRTTAQTAIAATQEEAA
ncbi:MAG: ribulose-phosphate 3-epimerase [Desulfobulbaceae bacterium]|jgi:ribulose-phosphate 3-epimerase|nr:ribulose-phosphate 3-epimerase [Desulfobulbaceae bacterium]